MGVPFVLRFLFNYPASLQAIQRADRPVKPSGPARSAHAAAGAPDVLHRQRARVGDRVRPVEAERAVRRAVHGRRHASDDLFTSFGHIAFLQM